MNTDYAAARKAVISRIKARSAWSRGVLAYALELIDNAEQEGLPLTREAMLNGAQDWLQYSEGACSLIYNADICERLCSPSEQRKCKDGDRNPNSRENWIECQARALWQACRHITASQIGV